MRFFVITCHNVFNVWPKTTLLPVSPRDTQRLDTLESPRMVLVARETNQVIGGLEHQFHPLDLEGERG